MDAIAQAILKTIGSLQNMAIGNCRKRIDEAAAKTRGLIGHTPRDDGTEHPCRKPPCGVTSILKERHGL